MLLCTLEKKKRDEYYGATTTMTVVTVSVVGLFGLLLILHGIVGGSHYYPMLRVEGFSLSSSSSRRRNTPPPPPPPQHQQPRQVKVTIQRNLPAFSTPQEARRAWLNYVWEKGGGLPLIKVVPIVQNDRDHPGVETTTGLQRRRRLVPIGMEEELLLLEEEYDKEEEEEEGTTTAGRHLCRVKYQVKEGGLLATEIVPDSHLAVVTFAATATDHHPGDDNNKNNNMTISMTWNVTFDTTSEHRTFLWQAVTERTITDTCNNFQAAMAIPKLYQRKTILRVGESSSSASSSNGPTIITPQQQAMDQWIDFCWNKGAGLPLPLPPLLQQNSDGGEGGGNVRWIIPPFLKERLLSSEIKMMKDDNINNNCGTDAKLNYYAEINYQVDNPSLLTYQVHSHRGRVRFLPDTTTNTSNNNNNATTAATSVMMNWEIEIRPYSGVVWSTLVQAFTGAVVSCYARNFKCHVQQGGKDIMVSIKPPRGSTGKTLFQVRKDSWIGGVLDAHLKDQRSTTEQTLALFQPWTWGRSPKWDEEGEGEEWTDGYLSD